MIHYPYLRTKKLNHGLTLTGDLLFNSDDAYDIGSSTAQAKDIYSDGVIYSDKLEIGESVPTASSLAIRDDTVGGNRVAINTTSVNGAFLSLQLSGSERLSIGLSGAITTLGNLIFTNGTGNIITSNNGNLTLLPNGSGITIVGDAGSTSHSLAANDHLFVTGSAEVDGNLFADGHFFPPTVTYSTNMNADVAGTVSEIVYCSTDSKAYVCTATGGAGSATWAALN